MDWSPDGNDHDGSGDGFHCFLSSGFTIDRTDGIHIPHPGHSSDEICPPNEPKSPLGQTEFPTTRLLHGFPGFDCVVPEHASDDWLTTAAQRSGLYNNPLSMSSRHVVAEPADLPLLGVHQPTHAIFRRMSVDEWAVLIGHR